MVVSPFGTKFNVGLLVRQLAPRAVALFQRWRCAGSWPWSTFLTHFWPLQKCSVIMVWAAVFWSVNLLSWADLTNSCVCRKYFFELNWIKSELAFEILSQEKWIVQYWAFFPPDLSLPYSLLFNLVNRKVYRSNCIYDFCPQGNFWKRTSRR